jgi:hypothetical protein
MSHTYYGLIIKPLLCIIYIHTIGKMCNKCLAWLFSLLLFNKALVLKQIVMTSHGWLAVGPISGSSWQLLVGPNIWPVAALVATCTHTKNSNHVTKIATLTQTHESHIRYPVGTQ